MIAATGARLAPSAWIHFPVSGGMIRIDAGATNNERNVEPTDAHVPELRRAARGRFCAACGQNDRSYLRATREIVGDVLSEVFDFDSRFGRTLKYLLLRAGFLSSEFASDRRASYVSPVRLYIVVSLVFFGVLSLTSRFESSEAEHEAIDTCASRK